MSEIRATMFEDPNDIVLAENNALAEISDQAENIGLTESNVQSNVQAESFVTAENIVTVDNGVQAEAEVTDSSVTEADMDDKSTDSEDSGINSFLDQLAIYKGSN